MKTCKMYESFLEKKKNTMNLQLGQLKFRNILFMIRDHLTLKSRTISLFITRAAPNLEEATLRQPKNYVTALCTTQLLCNGAIHN